MTNKFNFSCLFVGIVVLGFSGMASAALKTQTINFAVPNVTYPGTGTVTATTSSGLTVKLAVQTPAVCSISSKDGKTTVTSVAKGTCTIIANQAGNATYAAAPQVSQSFNILLAQKISFGAAPSVTAPGTGTVIVSASSGLPVILVSKSSACSIGGNTVTGLAAGTCVIAADQAGNTTYAAAPEMIQSFSVAVKVQVSGGGGGAKLAVTAPFNCATLASSGNAADDGRRAYNRLNCVSCHGQDGSGGMGPDIRGEGGDVAEAVNGEGAMPSYAGFLCPNDVIDLQAYLSSTSKTAKYLDWDLPIQQIKDGAPAAIASDIVVGP